MSDKLPDNVIKFTTLKTDYGKKKHCTCYEYRRVWPQYIVDTQNREITCKLCGNVVDHFEAMLKIANRGERLEEEVNSLCDRAKELSNYKPWLKRIRELESYCRSGTMVLSCPHCHQGILFEEMTGWTNKERELQRRKFREKERDPNA
ncbi:MAG: hypothetical protein K0Q85_6 [Caproiciproducens sp.]|nr:hypothetical protein [Caproiciproducens sp.]